MKCFDDVYRHCFGNLKISSKSFDIFETTTPTTEDDYFRLSDAKRRNKRKRVYEKE